MFTAKTLIGKKSKVPSKMKDKKFYKNKKPNVTVFQPGSRGNLHPELNFLDKIDCQVTYFKDMKAIIIDYDFDNINNVFRKSLYTTSVDTIINDFKGGQFNDFLRAGS